MGRMMPHGTFGPLRTRVELVARLGTRAFMVLAPSWSDVPTAKRVSVIAASAAADMALVRWLRQLPLNEHGWARRLTHIFVDVATNVALHGARATYTPAVGFTQAAGIEAGYAGDFGIVAAVPAVCLAGATVGRALRHRPPWPIDPVLLPMFAGLLGWGLRRYELAQLRAARVAEAIDREAAESEARASAHARLYTELDGSRLLDDLKVAIHPLVISDRAAVVATQGMLQERKEEALRPLVTALTLARALEAATAARYLDATNRASTFRPAIMQPAASTVLTARQARQLLDWINRVYVTGDPIVRVAGGGRRPGSGITLAVGARRCRLSADQAPIELAPLGWIAGAVMVATTVAPSDAAIPPLVVAFSSALYLGAAASSAALIRQLGTRGRPAAALVGLVPLLLHSSVGTATMRRRVSPSGVAKFPVVVPLMVQALEVGHYWDDLGPGARAIAATGALGAVACCWRLAEHSPRSLLAEMVGWPTQHFVLGRELHRMIDVSVARAARERMGSGKWLLSEDAINIELDLLERWFSGADAVLEAAVNADPGHREEASRRLAAARGLLDAIRREAAESSVSSVLPPA